MAPAADRLFGHFAVQLGLLEARVATQLAAAAHAGKEPLPRLLERTRTLPADDVSLLSALVERSVRQHGSPEKALASLSTGVQAATQSFAGYADTVQSGESRLSESNEALDFVVAELPGRYTPDARGELGRGGIGRVVSVKDQVLGRHVALKELLPGKGSATDTTTAEARFLREARLAAQLEHPAIVPVYEAGRRGDGALYYTMRRIEGRTLAEALAGAGSLEGRLTQLPHLLAVAQAVAYAHQRSVLHRDLKPHNVMLGSFGETWLLDWGLARVKGKADPRARELTLAPDITGGRHLGAMGTPSYMSPEQAAGKVDELDERTDVWGLGAMLYELLTGQPPYTGLNAIDCMSKVLTEDFTPPQIAEPDVPEDLAAVCRHALQKDKARRYADAAAFARDLEAWIAGRTVSAHAYSPWEMARRFVRKNRAATVAVTALVASLIAVTGLAAWRLETERREARALAELVVDRMVRRVGSVPGAEELLEEVTTPTLDFYLAREASLDLHERTLVAKTSIARGDTLRARGRLPEARRSLEDCRRALPWAAPDTFTTPRSAAAAFGCEILAFQLEDMSTSEAGMAAQGRVLEELLRLGSGRWPQDREYLTALSGAHSSVGRLALRHTETATAAQHLEEAAALDRQVLKLGPGDVEYAVVMISTLRELSLVKFDARAPEPSLALGREGLALARATPRRLQNLRLLRTWGATLQQQVMLLKWSNLPEEARALEDEGRRVFDQAQALAPDEVQIQGIYADFLLDLGRAADALSVLARVLTTGVKGDYFTSYCLAALAANQGQKVLDAQKEIAASDDPEAHWLYVLALAQAGRPTEALAELKPWRERAVAGGIQWPRGVLDGLPAVTAEPLREVVATFIRDMEAALAQPDPSEGTALAFEHLEAGLAEHSRTPASGVPSPP